MSVDLVTRELEMNKINKKDKFSFYVFCVVISSTLFSILLMTILNLIFDEYKSLNYVIFLCISFIFSSVIASIIISMTVKKSKFREELVLTLIEQVSNNNFDFRFDIKNIDEESKIDMENFNMILQELQSIAILKEDFISNFSHEFKTPITSIKGFAEILKSKPNLPIEERNYYLQIIIEESSKLTNLSKNILLISKLDSQSFEEKKEVYSLDEQLREVIIMLDGELSKKNINTDIDLDKIKICACKEMFNNVWVNLITNAIKFTNDEINISAKVEKNFIVVKVNDNGIGIKKEEQGKIFDKYYQCSNNNSTGNGLGLSICQKIIRLAKGKIEVESELNQGTTFIVYLPNELNKK